MRFAIIHKTYVRKLSTLLRVRQKSIYLENPMPHGTAPRRGIPLDIYACVLALALALLVRFNLIPPVKW